MCKYIYIYKCIILSHQKSKPWANDISIFLRVLPRSLGETQPADAERRGSSDVTSAASQNMQLASKNAGPTETCQNALFTLIFPEIFGEKHVADLTPSFLEPARSKQTRTTENIVQNKPDLLLGSTHILSLCRHFDSLFGSYQRSGKCRYIHSTPRQLIMHTSKALFACFNVTCNCQG